MWVLAPKNRLVALVLVVTVMATTIYGLHSSRSLLGQTQNNDPAPGTEGGPCREMTTDPEGNVQMQCDDGLGCRDDGTCSVCGPGGSEISHTCDGNDATIETTIGLQCGSYRCCRNEEPFVITHVCEE